MSSMCRVSSLLQVTVVIIQRLYSVQGRNTSVRDDFPRVVKSMGLVVPVIMSRDTSFRDTSSWHQSL
jgi:hypothetical protein